MKWENLVRFAEAEEDYIALYNTYRLKLSNIEEEIGNLNSAQLLNRYSDLLDDFRRNSNRLGKVLGLDIVEYLSQKFSDCKERIYAGHYNPLPEGIENEINRLEDLAEYWEEKLVA